MDSYPLHKGYLTKSPPDTRYTGRIKAWRRRWFVLYRNKNLQYYVDRGGEKKLKNTIDLNLCTCLDSNLSHKKFENIFSIIINGKKDGKSIKRTYFLVADTSYELQQWIEHICKVCDFQKDGAEDGISHAVNQSQETSSASHSEEPRNHDEHCPVSNSTLMSNGSRDSGIHVSPSENNNNSDLVSVSPPSQTAPMYDIVPAPRHGGELDAKGIQPDIPPPSATTVPVKLSRESQHYVSPPNRGILDISSSSEESISTQHRSSSEYEPAYDVPPSNKYQYDEVPPPVPLHTNKQYDVPTGKPIYDMPPAHPAYDTVPPPLSVASSFQHYANTEPPTKGIEDMEIYDIPPQVPNKPTHYQTPSLCSSNDTVPPHRERSYSDSSAAENYDTVPPPVQVPMGLPGIYDYVPRHENVDFDHSLESSYDTVAPPVPATPKPGKPYVNLTYAVKDTDVYDKPLPILPIRNMVNSERDSGTVADFVSDEMYDVPPKPGAPSNQIRQGAPTVDRSSKPMDQATPPNVNRFSKPERDEGRNYVNLPKSSTFREFDRKAIKSNLLRSKSAVSDDKAEGYLYMESPKRTDSSSRFSKKKISTEFLAESNDISYEYMDSSNACASVPYENINPQDLKQSLPKPETSDKRLKGHYQDIEIVCHRDAPTVPDRQRNTNYTTIDLEKTKGFRKTCADNSKSQ